MALDDITQKILDDARAEAAEIEKDTAEEVAVIERETREKKDELRREHERALEREKEHRRKQARSRTEQEKKQAVEMTKREHIDRVFDDAKAQLVELPGEQYQKLVTSLLEEVPGDVSGTLYAPSTRLPETKEALSAAGKSGLDVAEDASLGGGFRIAGETIDYDYSFERLIEDIRDKQELSVAHTLFSDVT